MKIGLKHLRSLALAVTALSVAATGIAQSQSEPAPMPGRPYPPQGPPPPPPIAPPPFPGKPAGVPTNVTVAPATAPVSTSSGTNSQLSSLVSTNAAVQSLMSDTAFQQFTNMAEHSPFVPSSQKIAGMNASSVEGAAFASALKLTGFFIQGSKVQASIEDRTQADKKYFVKAGEVIGDTEIKVAGFDLSNRAVLLEKGDEKARLEYEAAPTPPPGGKPGAPAGPPGAPPAFQPPQGTRQPPPQTTAQQQPAGGDASGRSARRRNRQQTIERLKQMLERTTDPATQQRLQNMIGMLEKADAQDAAEGGR